MLKSYLYAVLSYNVLMVRQSRTIKTVVIFAQKLYYNEFMKLKLHTLKRSQ
jgi:hypothetical protein